METEDSTQSEYVEEKKEMDKTIEAARHAVRLVSVASQNPHFHPSSSNAADVDAVSNLMQLNTDGMTDTEKNIMNAYVNDPKPLDSTRPQELLTSLNGMLSRLQDEHGAADKEQEQAKRKLS